MLIKKILAALPLSPAPKPGKKVEFTAGAALHQAGRCGEVLAVDVYDRERKPLYRFFSDGKGYIIWIERPFRDFTGSGWTNRNPAGGQYYSSPQEITASPESIAAAQKVLGQTDNWRDDIYKLGSAISGFISHVGQEKRWKAADNQAALQQAHFRMFPDYPADLARFCEERVFHDSVLYVSKLEKGRRKAVCRHCGKHFKVEREIRPGNSGHCPKCGWPVSYRGDWNKSEVTHRSKICIAHKVEGQLLLRYTDVQRTLSPDSPKPGYRFSDYFRTLFLVNRGKGTEYAYAWCNTPYYGYDWHRQRNGTENYGCTYVYTPNLREVFGTAYYNVDLQAGLSVLRRPLSFRRLLDNLKNVPQAEYLMKAGLPMLAESTLPDCNARNLTGLIGLGRQYLPLLRETQADFDEIRVIAGSLAAGRYLAPADIGQLCALDLDSESLRTLAEIVRYNTIGRILRYVRAQQELSSPPLKRRKLPYFIQLYRDYLNMAETLQSDMNKRVVLEPRNLKERHDLLAVRVNEQKDELENQRFQHAVEQGLYRWAREYANESYCVVYPRKRSDLTTEGQCLNHCVGLKTYCERHLAGQRMIFFIRKAGEPDKPYFTAEIDVQTGRILQLYGFGDCSAPKEVQAFTEGFAKAVLRWRGSQTLPAVREAS